MASSPRCCRRGSSGSRAPPRRSRSARPVAGTPTGIETLEHEVRIAAEPETVFGYFTDPLKMVEWMGAEATLDPRPGGLFRIGFRPSDAVADFVGGGGVNTVLGEFVEVEPYSR